jgi:hypothetical protein
MALFEMRGCMSPRALESWMLHLLVDYYCSYIPDCYLLSSQLGHAAGSLIGGFGLDKHDKQLVQEICYAEESKSYDPQVSHCGKKVSSIAILCG